MSTRLTQAEFDTYAAAWATFLDQADDRRFQQLFAPHPKTHYYQANVLFDVRTTMTELLSTPGIARVQARFVLLPNDPAGTEHTEAGHGETPRFLPRFRIVLYAVDGLGGRISAYFLGDAAWYKAPAPDARDPDKGYLPSLGDTTHLVASATAGPVPYNLIRGWVLAWQEAALHHKLGPGLFDTTYGPLQGYSFELGDLVNPLFTAGTFANKTLQLNLGLKSYYPAYPENPASPAEAFTLVARLYTYTDPARQTDPVTTTAGDKDGGGDEGGGPSYDMVTPIPPGH